MELKRKKILILENEYVFYPPKQVHKPLLILLISTICTAVTEILEYILFGSTVCFKTCRTE